MTETVKKTLKYLGLAVAIIGLTVTTAVITHNKIYSDCGLTDYNYMIYRDRTELALDGCRDAIVTEIDEYIDSVASDSGLNGIKLFELCDKYDVDVRFAMAQAEAESHFGTRGVAAKTNMVWNVKAYDNRTADDMIKKGDAEKHPDMSIEPYLILLTTKYLVDDKNELDMFEKRFSTTHSITAFKIGRACGVRCAECYGYRCCYRSQQVCFLWCCCPY